MVARRNLHNSSALLDSYKPKDQWDPQTGIWGSTDTSPDLHLNPVQTGPTSLCGPACVLGLVGLMMILMKNLLPAAVGN